MRGWILDLYTESPGKMVVWLKLEGGETRRLVDRWTPSIFVASDSKQDLADLEKGKGRDFSWSRRVMKLERATDRSESEVLELVVDDAKKLAPLAESVERSRPFGAYRLYNVDVPPEQMYLYENDLFPLAYCEVSETRDGLSWELLDDVWSCQYAIPDLRSVEIEVTVKKSGKMAKVSDPIESVKLKGGDGSVSSIDAGSEQDKILDLVEDVRRRDPDLVFTSDGDAFVLPYLAARAAANGISEKLVIDRDGSVLEAPAKKGSSYFSYGKILFKPSAMKLRGRVHLDKTSSFVHKESGLEGFYEVSRVCRLPLHTASRASIGKALSSLQFYHATKEGMLIPWKPVLAESFKSRAELLVADRGGFIFEPELGIHEGVGELDFSSLYPSIMMKKNISAETVRCACCPDSANRIPELGWNVCERRPQGIVPKAVRIIVEKRMKYKRLEQVMEGEERACYESRRNALKWVGVATFGYLGFNNAKFGRIDAHIGVCAWDRKVLVDAARVAERRGFRVMHGIVDSLWLKKEGAGKDDYERLRREIEAETKFAISFEGIYKWIAFLPSKVNAGVPVLNQYFGAYRDGRLKVRGIEARRHDTPAFFSKCQLEILELLARAETVEEARAMVDGCVDIFLAHARSLLDHRAPMEGLVFTRNLSKKPGEYANRSLTSSVADQLVQEGMELHAGEAVQYVITDYQSKSPGKRAVAFELADEKTVYDAKRYVELLAGACSTVLKPFREDCSAEMLARAVDRKILHAESLM
ncbi:MAG TPA: DNA polymerase domain-containing protein [Nitrososphaerales archaeon]|nr:DNA polymerase domain-containing protein [Nitrososphaerales archaeon]